MIQQNKDALAQPIYHIMMVPSALHVLTVLSGILPVNLATHAQPLLFTIPTLKNAFVQSPLHISKTINVLLVMLDKYTTPTLNNAKVAQQILLFSRMVNASLVLLTLSTVHPHSNVSVAPTT